MTQSLAARFHFLLRPSLPALGFALRTTAAAVVALAVALALGVDNPHWAAMTVWIVAQPTRGQLVSKGLYRLAGTVVGSVAAAAIILACGQAPLPLSLSLAAWIGLCAAASTVLPGFRAHGAVLAGYSAALVAVVGLGNHGDIAQVAAMRVASVAVGIVVSGATTLLFLPGSTARDLLVRARALSRDTLGWAVQTLAHDQRDDMVARQHRLLAEMAQLNAQADLAAAGSRHLGQRIAQVRGLISALLSLMAQIRARTWRPRDDDSELAQALRHNAALDRWPEIAAILAQISGHSDALARTADNPPADRLRHVDWRATLGAGLRAFGGVAAVGVLWTLTGWRDGPPMLMATAIMCSVFAASDTPSRNVLMAMKGTTLALASALAVALLLASTPASLPAAVAALVPFMVLGGLAMANRATIIPGTDYSMVLLLLSQPGVLAQPDPTQLANTGLGIVCGMGLAALVNRIGTHATPQARLDALSAEIVHDLTVLAAAAPGKGHRWRGKAFHRILRLVLKANEVGSGAANRLEGGLAALNVGLALSRLRLALGQPDLAPDRRAGIQAVLNDSRRLNIAPDQTARLALAEAGRQQDDVRAALFELADALTAQPGFFVRR